MAVPLVGRSNVDSMFSVVVLPAPLGPRKPKISPWFTVKLMPSTALMLLSKTFVSSLTSIVFIFYSAIILYSEDKNLVNPVVYNPEIEKKVGKEGC